MDGESFGKAIEGVIKFVIGVIVAQFVVILGLATWLFVWWIRG